MAAYIQYFGEMPTTILMQATGAFDGTLQTSTTPVITPGLYTFPPQTGGGLYSFHTEPIAVKMISFSGTGSLVIKQNYSPSVSSVIYTITSGGLPPVYPIVLSPGQSLAFTTSGPGILAITASLADYARLV